MLPFDTTPDAQRAYLGRIRQMSGSARVALAMQMSEDTRDIARAGISSRHPEYSPREVSLALYRLILGDETFRRAWPREALLAP